VTARHLSRGAALAVCLASGLLRGQLVTDEVPRERAISTKEEIRRDVDESRFRLGPLRLSPRFSIQNLGYNDNVFGATSADPGSSVSDYTATVSAGVRATLPLSSKVTLRTDVLPAYIWYAHEVERRSLAGTLSASLFALFNRLTFEATGFTSRADTVVSSEVAAIQRETVKAGRADLEIAFLRRLSLIASGDYQQRRYSLGGAEPPSPIDVARNDRKEWASRAGLRYRFSELVDVSAGVEVTWTEFYLEEQSRDNTSQAAIVGVHVERPRFVLNLSGAYRKGEERHGSGFPAYEEPTGSGFASITLVRPLDLELTGRRRISYSLSAESPYYFETRYGAGLKLRIGARVTLGAFGELGTNRYPSFANTGGVRRTDDAAVYGGTATIVFARNVSANASFTRSRYDSNIDTFDRRYNQFGVGITVGGDFLR
jgi:hypothetical protein